jgi:hypothetical protein
MSLRRSLDCGHEVKYRQRVSFPSDEYIATQHSRGKARLALPHKNRPGLSVRLNNNSSSAFRYSASRQQPQEYDAFDFIVS